MRDFAIVKKRLTAIPNPGLIPTHSTTTSEWVAEVPGLLITEGHAHQCVRGPDISACLLNDKLF